MSRNTIADDIFKKLLKEIITLKIMPGEKLSETIISKKFNVSRAPIKHAISKLESENLIVVKPQIGTFVKPISYEDIKNICEIRLLLEPYATEKAAMNINPISSEMSLLKKCYNKLDNFKGEKEEKISLLYEIDLILHKTIWDLCGNKEISIIIESYRNKIDRARLLTAHFTKRRIELSREEVIQIFDGLLSKKPSEANVAMHSHLNNFKKAILELIEKMIVSGKKEYTL